MSLASLGVVSSFAATSASQRNVELERGQRETMDQARAAKAVENAASAAGIGQTEEDSETSDRDADGRRPWEIPAAQSGNQPPPEEPTPAGLSKDPSKTCGSQLDLMG